MTYTRSHSLFTDFDIYLFGTGKHFRLWEKLGSHMVTLPDGTAGSYFALWAPNAREVSVVGAFNFWNRNSHHLHCRLDASGIWEGFIPGVGRGDIYKFNLLAADGREINRGDPFAKFCEAPPSTAGVVWQSDYAWTDDPWLKRRQELSEKPQPWSVYEVHPGSWKKPPGRGGHSLSYLEMADELVAYVKDMGFTHVELMPVMEHPYFASWGYQITNFFAPSARFGHPEDLMALIDAFHREGIGVILDWVPSHFPSDEHGLYNYDGTHLYEHADPRKGFHPDWGSYIFNYGRDEVRSFLLSNALYWLELFHVDGLRVDAVASMLYLDYSRKEGEWIPNEFGGRENLEAISFLKEFNHEVRSRWPGVETIAEESTAFPGVTSPTFHGGLGFSQKWMMGWMHDTLDYFKRMPVWRRWHQSQITFSTVYMFSERFMLPLSHDEVVHGKASLLYKMPGDEWQKFAQLRLLFGFQWMHPGSKLLFMGGEFGQTSEWSHDLGLFWGLLEHPFHRQAQAWVRALNQFYAAHPALWFQAFAPEGWEWISGDDDQNSVMSFIRHGSKNDKPLVVVCQFQPNAIEKYQLGLPHDGEWVEVLNSDDSQWGGSGMVNAGAMKAVPPGYHWKPFSINIRLAPYGVQVFEGVEMPKKSKKKNSGVTIQPGK